MDKKYQPYLHPCLMYFDVFNIMLNEGMKLEVELR